MIRGRGFTLIEMAVVVAIVALLGTIAMPYVIIEQQRGKEQALRHALREIREALDAYKREVDAGRITRKIGASGYPPRLEDLVQGVPDISSPNGQQLFFLRRLPRDPFNPESDLPAAATWGKRCYASPPDQPSEGEDVYDIYSQSEGVGLNGVPYREW